MTKNFLYAFNKTEKIINIKPQLSQKLTKLN